MERGHQVTLGLSKTAIFSTFTGCFLRSFRDKAKVIITYYLVPHRLSTDPVIHELE